MAGAIGAGTTAGAGIGSLFGPVGTGIGAGIGAIGGGVVDFLGQQSANEQNWDEFVSNQIWNTTQINAARNYNTEMSNTAYQRAVADMKKAGINPMMAAMNGGASSPTSPITNAGTGAAMQNPAEGLGKSISGAMGSALQAANLAQDLKNADADITLKNAQALTQVSLADQANSNARLNYQETSNKFLDQQRSYTQYQVEQAEAKARENRANLDIANDARERILNQIKQGSGIVTDAVKAISPRINFGGGYNENDMLNAAKGKGVLTK